MAELRSGKGQSPTTVPVPGTNTLEPVSLERVLGYANADVIYSFMVRFDMCREECEDIFQEMLRYLWLCAELRRRGIQTEIPIDQPLRVIDEMWHSFILHTSAYRCFCHDVFGEFVDHQPLTAELQARFERERDALDVAAIAPWIADRKRPAYRLVYDLLGEEIFRKWYFDYGRRYSPSRLLELRRR